MKFLCLQFGRPINTPKYIFSKSKISSFPTHQLDDYILEETFDKHLHNRITSRRVVGEWQRKEFLWFHVSFQRRPKSLSLFSTQQFRDRLLEGASVVHPHEVDGMTSLLGIMVEPFAASYGHTVICGQTLIPARGK